MSLGLVGVGCEPDRTGFDDFIAVGVAAHWQHAAAFVYLSPRSASGGTALLLSQPGQPAVSLTDGRFRDGAALWAHDGRRIAFQAYRDSTWQIWTVAADGSRNR